jgi:hypothetical protein
MDTDEDGDAKRPGMTLILNHGWGGGGKEKTNHEYDIYTKTNQVWQNSSDARRDGSGDLSGQHRSMLIIKPLFSAFSASRQALIFITKEIKANRSEHKSPDYINEMMLVGQQR